MENFNNVGNVLFYFVTEKKWNKNEVDFYVNKSKDAV